MRRHRLGVGMALERLVAGVERAKQPLPVADAGSVEFGARRELADAVVGL